MGKRKEERGRILAIIDNAAVTLEQGVQVYWFDAEARTGKAELYRRAEMLRALAREIRKGHRPDAGDQGRVGAEMEAEAMNLYRVVFDGQPDFVEAETFSRAIELWRAKLISENEPDDFEDNVEPESVELVHESPVVRKEAEASDG